MNELNIGITLIAIALIFVSFQIGRSHGLSRVEKKEDAGCLKEILAREREILDLRKTIDELNRLNDRYLSFLVKIPMIVQRLNATMKVDEIISSVIELLNEMIPAKTVEFYLLDDDENFLKEVSSPKGDKKMKIYAVGEGMVGLAAQHRMVQQRENFIKKGKSRGINHEPQTDLEMAVPVQFRERILGVIGIGGGPSSAGNEISLMKMIADIAGVALTNQSMLGEAKHKANTDALTGLNNRNYLFQMAQNYVAKSIREGTSISIFLFDIDNFKQYNDMNGHNAGDALLKELSDVIRKSTRKDSVIVRYGGEEFIVMLPGISKEDAFIYAERLRAKIADHPFKYREMQPLGRISVSGGVASFPVDGDSIYKIIQLADAALYKAKSEGRNRVVMHQSYFFSESDPSSTKAVTA